jgi:CubicO group peptidase (beta-lactamase class C family)
MKPLDRRAVLAGASLAALATPAQAQPARAPSPQEIRGATMSGAFSTERLARMHDIMAGHVAGGRLPGIVTLVSRRGETHADAIGTMAFGASQPMRRDAIFRGASITKPIVAAAAMILVEECRLRLDDPIDKFIPELAGRKVIRTLESAVTDTVPAKRPLSLRDLLTFRCGYGAIMVFPSKYPIQKAMEDAGVAPGPMLPSLPADELMKRYGSLPLVHQPGEQWLYNSGSDILGVLIARASGKTLGAFLQERIFAPLGMKDTGFHVPAEKLDRLPECYSTDFSTGKTQVFDPRNGRFAQPATFESGAGGLVTTADDYLAFARMMLNQGRHGDARILSRASVALMTTDHITPEQKAASRFFEGFWDNRGWGFGLAVVTRRDSLSEVPGRFGWDGGYGTSAYMDPANDLVGILMTQRVWDEPKAPAVLTDFWTAAYQAIEG